jgi:CO/xanthine dehydrogenase Mo-binding subunit
LKKSKCDRASLEGLVGEVCFVGIPSAIANAVYQATGPRIRSLRITIDQLL